MYNFNQMPAPPVMNYQYAVDAFGNRIPVETYAPQQPYQNTYQQPQYYQQPAPVEVQPQQKQYNGIGANFSNLIGTNVSVPVGPQVPTEKPKRKRKSSESKDGKEEVVSAKAENIAMVEEVSYTETFQDTTRMLKGAIAQVDELAGEIKIELDKIRSTNNMKGKYTYLANLSGALSGLIGTKVTAIREINSSIKAANDAEYRRYKDIRATDAQDDSKAIMDMYNAYIHTPVGSIPGIQYQQPSTYDITAMGMNGIVKVDSVSQETRDAGFNNFLSNLTPEQNAMIHEGNPNIQEVIIYDQATGKKYFDWIDASTGKSVPNMPKTDPSFLEDYTIDPRTRTAKNINLHNTMKVIYTNEGVLNEY